MFLFFFSSPKLYPSKHFQNFIAKFLFTDFWEKIIIINLVYGLTNLVYLWYNVLLFLLERDARKSNTRKSKVITLKIDVKNQLYLHSFPQSLNVYSQI